MTICSQVLWRGARAVEWARLESECTVYSRTEGSNPSLSAILRGPSQKRAQPSLPLAVRKDRPIDKRMKISSNWRHNKQHGEVAERLNAPVLKTGKG